MSWKISGIGVTGAFGSSLKEMTEAVSRAERKPDLLSWDDKHHMEVFKAKTAEIAKFFPKNLLRRTDHFSKMALLASSLAFEKCENREEWSGDDTGIIVATGYGSIGSTCRFKDSVFASNDKGPSPLLFSRSVHNQAASHLAILLGITGPNLTISQHYLSFHSAMQTACLWLMEQKVKRVLVGGIDEFDPVLAYSRKRFIQKKPADCSDPALQDYRSIPGEGAGFFLLEQGGGKKGSILEIPRIDRTSGNNFVFPKNQGTTVCYDCSRTTPSCIKKKSRQADPRRFYGEFPTAAALDLAFAMATTPGGQEISCIQMTGERRYGIIQARA
ncbi:beta-ketoacyl synthase N-terminal-like domain-containing protein [Desulfomarina sp.]